MKKILMILAAVVVLASCGSSSSPADQAVSYAKQIEKAMADQDYEALMKIQSEMQEWQAGLSEEEFKEAEEAFTKYMMGSKVMGDENFLDTAADYAVDAYETASEYAKDAYDVASEYAVEAYDVASEYAKEAYDVASEYAKDAYKEAEDLLEDLF